MASLSSLVLWTAALVFIGQIITSLVIAVALGVAHLRRQRAGR